MCMRWSLVCRSCLLLPPPSVCWCYGRAVCVCVPVAVDWNVCRAWCLLLCRFFSSVPLCVDGELVCAEGYTQATGVMAMMMTGRVLLVCALCVLWCGAGGGDAWAHEACGSGAEPCYNSSWYNKTFSTSFRSSFLGETNSTSGGSGASSTDSTANGGDRARMDGNGSTDAVRNAQSGSTHSPSGTSQPPSQLPAGATETTSTLTAAPPPPAGGPENNTAETELGGPEGEDEGTQESQPPEGNGTEAPTTATVTAAQTNATMMFGDSDGSTAVSHTNSPLFLFLFVCAAAAAMVVAA
ncbi:mucin-associated surface protein (MASP), putative [Trypanosoma cruzi marinkellei]|uniref:Mucin-associated surface protein (MASP), putative n=1 Tax=Trypanosoma cruzi marinkellei TaxID=85056 RepID=K2N5U6_TRYCR|nr:mucin-associated surface protein (MASP), putative [Trypanosoma cruzi marinkellei]